MLSLDAVNVWRGPSCVLRDVSLTVEEGEIIALLGANGAGKTSTLLAISGLLRPRSGTMTLRDGHGGHHDLATLAPSAIVAAGVAHCPEGRQVFGGMSVLENLKLGAYLRRDRGIACDEVRPGPDEIVLPKTSSSLFNSTVFEYLLRNIGIDTVVVGGFLTDQCVDHTIRDGADRGFRMVCAVDACTTDSRDRHDRAIAAFKGYCRTATTDALSSELARQRA